jgi:phospho-N-acetylmuramoyl-pentapeptide-transferase
VIRLLIAAATAIIVSLFGTRYLIRWLTTHRIGQPIRAEGPQGHQVKAGTPTMGGIAIVGGASVGYVVSNVYQGIYTRTGLIVMAAIVGAAIVGGFDDWIKVTRARNLGLSKRAKLGGQLAVAIGFAAAIIHLTLSNTTLSFTRWNAPGIELGSWAWAGAAVLWFLGSTNAVNLTDGLDGLAAGSSILGFAAYTVIAFWQFRNEAIYMNAHALDLAVVAAAMLGGCIGFLWWNAAPAQIFMGDTGSLAIGAAFATLALSTDTQLLLPIMGGLFVVETASVMIQVAVYRLQRSTPPAQRRRPFRMAPLHHHFELGGWPETTVIVRFWIIAGLCVAVGLGLFYADFLSTGAGGL